MAFTKDNSAENKAMGERADDLLVEFGFNPALANDFPATYKEHVARCVDFISKNLAAGFPAVTEYRRRRQAAMAVMRARAYWIRERNKEEQDVIDN